MASSGSSPPNTRSRSFIEYVKGLYYTSDPQETRVISDIDPKNHKYWINWTQRIGLFDSESDIVTSWRMRDPFTLPQSWTEVGLFVGLAVAVQVAYWVLWPTRDDPSDDFADNSPGGFPLDKINPMKRHEAMLIQAEEDLSEIYRSQQRQEEMKNMKLQELYFQNKLSPADIEQLMNDAAALQDAESIED